MLKEKPDLPERKKETVIKLSDDNERLEIYPYKKAFPNLYLVGKQNYTKAHGEFKLHSHADAYEIHYLVSGQQDFTVGRENYKLKGGDIFITYPYEAHGSSRKILEKAKLF
ncbi:MAG TPA: AraC family ligand binding domain-containing protein, partial [Spirochaetota bacterium]|nr:AraC family ligand binding domain-containing protein [Spirochaetota bacterium]